MPRRSRESAPNAARTTRHAIVASLSAVALLTFPAAGRAAPLDASPASEPGSADDDSAADPKAAPEAAPKSEGSSQPRDDSHIPDASDPTAAPPGDEGPERPVPSPDVDAKVQPSAAGEGPDVARNPGGVGNVIDPDDPDAQKATAELEGEQLEDELPPGVPERMAPMQAAAWWTLFGAVTLGATGGVFAGLAEREEDKALRLQRTFDPETGSRVSFAEVRDDYDASLRRGRAYAWTSRGLLIGGGALLITSISLFVVHARRTKAERGADAKPSARGHRKARLERVGAGFVEVSF